MSDDWLRNRAKEMRREPALYERRLWKLLRDRRLAELKFRRQVVIGRYIADFVCFRHRLIVEADGPLHDEQVEHDAARDAWLAAEGFLVLRFTNQQIESRGWEVIGAIIAASERRVTNGRLVRPLIRQPSPATFSRKGRRKLRRQPPPQSAAHPPI